VRDGRGGVLEGRGGVLEGRGGVREGRTGFGGTLVGLVGTLFLISQLAAPGLLVVPFGHGMHFAMPVPVW
jgi:hypothetical protein